MESHYVALTGLELAAFRCLVYRGWKEASLALNS